MSSSPAPQWMDGIPLELRPRYYPKPPLKFKEIDIYIPLDAIENDYDFTEERRVLTEHRMWEERKEKERQEEEERRRLRAEEEERLRKEAEALEIERLAKEAEAELEEPADSSDQETLLNSDLASKLILGDSLGGGTSAGLSQLEDLDNSIALAGVPNLFNSSSNSSKHNSQHESPTTSEVQGATLSQPHSTLQSSTTDQEALGGVPVPPIHHQTQTINGYHYMMGSDIQMPTMYHGPVPPYYNFCVPPPAPPAVVAPTPIYPQVSMPSQCPYPPSSWNHQNGYYTPQPQPPPQPPSVTSTPSNPVVSTSIAPPQSSQQQNQNGYYPQPQQQQQQQQQAPPLPPGNVVNVTTSNTVIPNANSIAPPQPQQNSHIPSPTQAIEQQQQAPQQQPQTHQTTNPEADASSDNSFTKLHFPFLTSMAASTRSARDRDGGLGYLTSSFNRTYGTTPPQHSSSDDIATQNPFLSNYVQSHAPMQRHQYWPTSHLSHQQQPAPHHHQTQTPYGTHTPVQNGPVQSAIGTSNFIATSGPSVAPPEGSQHALL